MWCCTHESNVTEWIHDDQLYAYGLIISEPNPTSRVNG